VADQNLNSYGKHFKLKRFILKNMFVDVCLPKNNEEEFIKAAEKLGTKGLLFLYEKKEKNISSLQTKTKIKLYSGTINGSSKINFVKAEQQNIVDKNSKFLYGFEDLEKKDSFHYRRSGTNQVLCKLIKTKNKVFVLDMEKIFTSSDKETLLGRLQQNLMLIRKYKLDLIICSFATKSSNLRAEEEYKALIRSLGYQEEARNATKTLSKFLL